MAQHTHTDGRTYWLDDLEPGRVRFQTLIDGQTFTHYGPSTMTVDDHFTVADDHFTVADDHTRLMRGSDG